MLSTTNRVKGTTLFIATILCFPSIYSERKRQKINALITILFLTLFSSYGTFAQTEFELEPSQSMLMTGKGPGQDATINPYDGQNCLAIVENIGNMKFSIRVQQKGKIIETIPISKGEVKKVTLLKGYELYLDSSSKGKVKARVDYERIAY